MSLPSSRSSKAITSLRPGQPIPDGPPARYLASHGYVRLRWKLARGQYVETYEHRVIDGHVTTAEQVHHRNRRRHDNRPENLEHLTAAEHAAEHRAEDRQRIAPAVELYKQGLTTTEVGRRLGVGAPCVTRMLQRAGVEARTKADYARPLDQADIVARYLAGQGVRRIKADLRVSDKRIRAVLVEAGIELRGPGRVRGAA